MHESLLFWSHLGRPYIIIPLLSLIVGWIPASKRVSDKVYAWLVLGLTSLGWKVIFLHVYASLPFVQKQQFLFKLISFLSGVPLSTASYRLIGVVYTIIFSVMGLLFLGEGEIKQKRQQLKWLNITLLAFLMILESTTWPIYGLGAMGAVLIMYRLVACPMDGPHALLNGQMFMTGMGSLGILLGGAISVSSLIPYETMGILMGIGSLWGLYFLLQRLSLSTSEPLTLFFYPYGCLLIPLLTFMKWGMNAVTVPFFIQAVTVLGSVLMISGGTAGFLSTTLMAWRRSFRWMGVGLVLIVTGHYSFKPGLTALMSFLCIDGLFSLYAYIFGDWGSPAVVTPSAKPRWIQKGTEGFKKCLFFVLFSNAMGLIPYGTGWGLWNALWPASLLHGTSGLPLGLLYGLFFAWSLLLLHGALLQYTCQGTNGEEGWGRFRLFHIMCLFNMTSGLISTAYPWETIFEKSTLPIEGFLLALPYAPTYALALGFNLLGSAVYLTGFFWGWPFKKSVPFGLWRFPLQWGRSRLALIGIYGERLTHRGLSFFERCAHVWDVGRARLTHIAALFQIGEDVDSAPSAVSTYRYLFFVVGILIVIGLWWGFR